MSAMTYTVRAFAPHTRKHPSLTVEVQALNVATAIAAARDQQPELRRYPVDRLEVIQGTVERGFVVKKKKDTSRRRPWTMNGE